MLAPDRDSQGLPNYTLFLEGKPPPGFDLRLEAELQKNPQYAICRDLHQLGALRCFDIPRGAYDTFCKAQLSEGLSLGEIKPQHLSTRTDWCKGRLKSAAGGANSAHSVKPMSGTGAPRRRPLKKGRL